MTAQRGAGLRGPQFVGSTAGLRCQLHKAGERVALYTEDLRDIAAHFPALVAAARALRGEVILDGELVAVRDGRHLPTRAILRHLKGAVQDDLFPETRPAVQFLALDLCYQDGVSWIESDAAQRCRRLAGLDPLPPGIQRRTGG